MHGLVAIAPLPPVPRHDLLTYRVPEPLRERVRPGVRVRVPLGRQTRTGVVAAFADALPPGELRSIVDVLDADPFLPADLLELCRWTARYYFVSLAEVIATIVPASEIGKHTSELQSRFDLVCRLLLEKKNRHRTTRYQCLNFSHRRVSVCAFLSVRRRLHA